MHQGDTPLLLDAKNDHGEEKEVQRPGLRSTRRILLYRKNEFI
jgi:hypothetical protein